MRKYRITKKGQDFMTGFFKSRTEFFSYLYELGYSMNDQSDFKIKSY